MSDKDNQQPTPPAAAAEPKNTEKKQEEQLVPKASLDAVSDKYKAEKVEREKLSKELDGIKNAQLKEKEDFKTLAEKLEAENKTLKMEGLKRDLISEAITSKKLHPRLSKLVTGSTEKEIKKSIEETLAYQEDLTKQLKGENAAPDNSGSGKPTPKGSMTSEEYLRLMEENPKEAERKFQEAINANKK